MKKIFTTLFMVLSVLTLVQAQNRSKGIEFGIGGGYTRSYMVENATNKTSTGRNGFNLFVSADNYFSDRWSLKAKIAYDEKGFTDVLNPRPNVTVSGVDFKLMYITVPVMANWHFGKTRNWHLNFGPYIGFLQSAEENYSKINLKPNLNSTDLGFSGGIGIKIPVSNQTKFFIEYEWQSGFTNVIKNMSPSVQNARNSLNIGFNF